MSTDPLIHPDDAEQAEENMRHSYARTSAISSLHTAMRQADGTKDQPPETLMAHAEFLVDLGLDLTRAEVVILVVGNEDSARRVAEAVIRGGQVPDDYQLRVHDVAEGHRVIRRLAGLDTSHA